MEVSFTYIDFKPDGKCYYCGDEWMQTTEPNQYDHKKCMSYGSDNSIFVVRVANTNPN